jgi:trehalose 6-phosphate phosphatase
MRYPSAIKRGAEDARHLFRCWEEIALQIRERRTVALFLDFDGTLVEIQPHPEQVSFDAAARRTLSQLALNPRVRVWVISGRRQADVRARTRVPGIHYRGLHGWEGRAHRAIPQPARDAIAATRETLRWALARYEGIWVEDKLVTFTIHYRDANENGIRRAWKCVQDAVAPFNGLLHLFSGKKMWEVTPEGLGNKGSAVLQELASVAGRPLPIYVGDDLVDEPAFSALGDGVTVRVGDKGPTGARYRLSSVRQVHQFLERLEKELA